MDKDFVLDMDMLTLSKGTNSIKLTPTQARIVEILAQAKCGKSVSTSQIIEKIYIENEEPENAEDALRVFVSQVRAKTAKAGFDKIIKTVWGIGFALTDIVTIQRAGPGPIIVPFERRDDLERLLHSHPDRKTAGRILASLAGML